MTHKAQLPVNKAISEVTTSGVTRILPVIPTFGDIFYDDSLAQQFVVCMKHLLTPLVVTVLISGCSGKYGSEYEAKAACNEWRKKADVISITYEMRQASGHWNPSEGPPKDKYKTEVVKKDNRLCQPEEKTNQYLGIQHTFSKEDLERDGTHAGKRIVHDVEFGKGYENSKVVKHFRY